MPNGVDGVFSTTGRTWKNSRRDVPGGQPQRVATDHGVEASACMRWWTSTTRSAMRPRRLTPRPAARKAGSHEAPCELSSLMTVAPGCTRSSARISAPTTGCGRGLSASPRPSAVRYTPRSRPSCTRWHPSHTYSRSASRVGSRVVRSAELAGGRHLPEVEDSSRSGDVAGATGESRGGPVAAVVIMLSHSADPGGPRTPLSQSGPASSDPLDVAGWSVIGTGTRGRARRA